MATWLLIQTEELKKIKIKLELLTKLNPSISLQTCSKTVFTSLSASWHLRENFLRLEGKLKKQILQWDLTRTWPENYGHYSISCPKWMTCYFKSWGKGGKKSLGLYKNLHEQNVILRLEPLMNSLSIIGPGATPWAWERSWGFMVPISGNRPISPPVSRKRPAATTAEAPPPWWSASDRRTAAAAVIAAFARASTTPKRRWSTASGAFFTSGQLNTHSRATHGSSIQFSHSIGSISRILKLYESEAWGITSNPHAA